MKCPHCLVSYHPQNQTHYLGEDIAFGWIIDWQPCPRCKKFIIYLLANLKGTSTLQKDFLVYPRAISRAPIPPDVPDLFANDYKEACSVIADSPKASAALSRRCLQNLLREKAGIKKSDLSKAIDEVLESKQLSSSLAEGIDAVRTIGNFATHPIKSTHTGEIVDVEPGEAEWLLDILEGLFDFYFVQPAELQRKKEALNRNLSEAGKPPLK